MASDDHVPSAHRTRALEAVLGGERRLTRDEVVAGTSLDVESARRLWRALGFPDVGDTPAFTPADARALALIEGLMADGRLDLDGAIDVARSMGQTASRLAQWEAGRFTRHLVDEGVLVAGRPATQAEWDAIVARMEESLPVLDELLVYSFHRHLADVVAHAGVPADDEPGRTVTVGFADLVGYTRLSRRLSPDELAGLVERFDNVSADTIALAGAWLVKTLGDEVLFLAEDPVVAAETATLLHEAHGRDESVPELRIGLATGPVVERLGDVFGPTVNLAARLTSLALPGRTLCDRVTGDAVHLARRPGGEAAFHVREAGPRPVRGVGIAWPQSVEVRELA